MAEAREADFDDFLDFDTDLPVPAQEADATGEKKKRAREESDRKDKKKSKDKRDKRHKKEKKKKRSAFVDDVAGGSEEEEEYEEVDTDENLEYIKNHHQQRHFFEEGEGELDEEQLAQRLEDKYKADRARQKDERSDRSRHATTTRTHKTSVRFSSAVLPKPEDPKIFAVKCRKGDAESLVARIVNKCHAFRQGINAEKKKIDLGVTSAFTLNNVREWVYIEAYRRHYVDDVIAGLEGVFRFRIVTVDPKELLHLMETSLSQAGQVEQLSVGDLVRVKTNPHYKHDLAQVVAVEAGGKRCTVKVVPREDYIDKEYMKRPRKGGVQYAPKLFMPALAKGAKESNSGTWVWGDLTFDKDGYLLLTSSTKWFAFGTKMVKPTVAELADFFKRDAVAVAQTAAEVSDMTLHNPVYKNGEPVRVIKGQLRGATGKIIDMSRSEGWLNILCKRGTEAPVQFRVEASTVTKFFEPGNHVRVLRGQRQGETGSVIYVQNDLVVFVSDATGQEVEVVAHQCEKTSVVAPGSHQLGTWRLYDLVLLSNGAAGCIVRLSNLGVVVMFQDGITQNYQLTDLQDKLRIKHAACSDQYGNAVIRGEAVVCDGPACPPHLYGKKGKVEQVYMDTLYVISDSILENAGLFTIAARSVTAIGAKIQKHKRTKMTGGAPGGARAVPHTTAAVARNPVWDEESVQQDTMSVATASAPYSLAGELAAITAPAAGGDDFAGTLGADRFYQADNTLPQHRFGTGVDGGGGSSPQ